MVLIGFRTKDNCYNWIPQDLRKSRFKEKEEEPVSVQTCITDDVTRKMSNNMSQNYEKEEKLKKVN